MRVGPTVLLTIAMLVAPAVSVAAQPSTEPETLGDDSSQDAGDDEYDAVVVHETDDHYVVEVTVPTSAYDRNHEAYFSVPVTGDRVDGSVSAGGGDAAYEVVVDIEPQSTEKGSISLDEAGWDTEVVLEQRPDSPLPVLAEQAEGTLDEQLDELEQRTRALMDDTEEMRALLDEVRQDAVDTGTSADDQPLTENATEVLDRRLEMTFELLVQTEDELAWLTEPVREVPASEIVETLGVVDASYQLAYILLTTSQQILEEHLPDDGDTEVESPDEVDQAIEDLNETLQEHVEWLVGPYQEIRDSAFTNAWWAYDVTSAQIDEAFRTVHQQTNGDDGADCEEEDRDENGDCPSECPEGEERNDEGECEDACPDDDPTACPLERTERIVLEGVRSGLKTVEENYTDTERTVLDAVGSASAEVLYEQVPDDYPDETTRATYDSVDENYSALMENHEDDAIEEWSDERVQDTLDTMRLVDQHLRWLVEDWLQQHPEVGSDHGLDEDLRKMLDASRAQLNESQDQLEALTSDDGDEDGEDDGEDDQDDGGEEDSDESPVEQAWAASNRSRENVTEAIETIEAIAYTERPVEKALQEAAERVDRPTQLRVLVPKDLPSPGDDEPGTSDITDEIPDDEELPDDEDAEDTLQEETPGDGPESPHDDIEEPPATQDDDSGTEDDGSDESADDGSGDDSDGADDDGGADETGSEDGSDDVGDESGGGAGSESSGGSGDEGGSSDGGSAPPGTDVVLQPDELVLEEGEQEVAAVEVRNDGDGEQTYHVTAEEDGPATVEAPEEASATLEPGEVATLRTLVTPTGAGEGTLTYHLSGATTSTHDVPFEVRASTSADEALSVKTSPWHVSLDPDESRLVTTTVENVADRPHAVSVDAWGDGPVSAETGEPDELELEPGEEATFEVTITPKADGLGEVTTRVSTANGDAVEPLVLVSAGDAPGFSGTFPSAEDDGQGGESADDDERGLPLPAVVGLVALIGAALTRRKHT